MLHGCRTVGDLLAAEALGLQVLGVKLGHDRVVELEPPVDQSNTPSITWDFSLQNRARPLLLVRRFLLQAAWRV